MERWFIAHNGNDIIHWSKLNPDQVFATGQPIVEEFTDEDSFKTALQVLSETEYNNYLDSLIGIYPQAETEI